jgi:transcriptional regulator with XRE-family HTH domain
VERGFAEMTVGERIRERRIELKLTQEELGKRLGYGKSAVCRVEKEGNNITSNRIEKFAKALECTPGYLMGWTATPNQKQLNIFDIEGDTETADEIRKERFEKRFKFETDRYTTDLSTEESVIIECYRKLQEPEKEMIRRMLPYYEMLKERR